MSGFTRRNLCDAVTTGEPPPSADFLIATAPWFVQPQTRAIFDCLNREGFEVRAVGGAVRNTLAGRPVTEVDFATTASPDDMIRLAAKAGIKSLPTGIAHGTVTLIAGGIPFEVTALRRDTATDGRHATVVFGGGWEDDAGRRDFTINALYASADGSLYDPLGGLADLRAGHVRFAGDALARIHEDYLRILRFFRFSADFAEGAFDRTGVEAAIKARAGLLQLSRERVRTELLRLLIARRASGAVAIMDESGLLLMLLGGVARRMRFERLCLIEAALGYQPDPILRLAALGAFIEEDAERLSQKLRLSSAEASALLGLAAASPVVRGDLPRAALEALIYKIGARPFLGRLLIAWASEGAAPSSEAWHFAAQLASTWQRPEFPIGGADLIAAGFSPGPALGAMLRRLENEWIAGGFILQREALFEMAARKRGAAES